MWRELTHFNPREFLIGALNGQCPSKRQDRRNSIGLGVLLSLLMFFSMLSDDPFFSVEGTDVPITNPREFLIGAWSGQCSSKRQDRRNNIGLGVLLSLLMFFSMLSDDPFLSVEGTDVPITNPREFLIGA